DEMRAVGSPQHIADMAVAVQPDRGVAAHEAAIDAGERLLRHGLPRLQQIGGDEVRAQQEGACIVAEGLRGERVAMLEFPGGADGVDAPDEASDPLERAFVAELGCAAATARIDRDAEIGKLQGMHGRDDGDLEIFRGLSLRIPRGQVVAILGASGSGKSTLLRLIGAQLTPSGGSVRVAGLDVHELSSEDLYRLRLEIGMMFQNSGLFTDSTVFDNIAFPI